MYKFFEGMMAKIPIIGQWWAVIKTTCGTKQTKLVLWHGTSSTASFTVQETCELIYKLG
jgi:hypothetical protein